MSSDAVLSVEDFINAARQFCETSDKIGDAWKFFENETDAHRTYIKKECFSKRSIFGTPKFLKAEYIIFYNLSYGVPSFSFNIWDSSGVLLTLDDIRQMSFINIKKEDFYSVITQQEHPVLFRPYFVIHPCHTALLIKEFKKISKNIIVTFLSLITPLIRLDLRVDYGI